MQADVSDTYCCYWELAADFTNPQLPEQQHIYVCMNAFVQLTHARETDFGDTPIYK